MIKHCNTLRVTLWLPLVFNLETKVYIRSPYTLATETQLLATTLNSTTHVCMRSFLLKMKSGRFPRGRVERSARTGRLPQTTGEWTSLSSHYIGRGEGS